MTYVTPPSPSTPAALLYFLYNIYIGEGITRMIVTIILDPGQKDDTKLRQHISDIVRNSYDYQKDNMYYERCPEGYRFVFYLEDCDQPKRTLKTIRDIEDLIMSCI